MQAFYLNTIQADGSVECAAGVVTVLITAALA